MKVSNKTCRPYVQNRREFQGHNLFGTTVNGNYVVYSYGRHFPLFAFVDGSWYSNSDKYSVSTSKQRTQSHPQVNTIDLNTSDLKSLIGA